MAAWNGGGVRSCPSPPPPHRTGPGAGLGGSGSAGGDDYMITQLLSTNPSLAAALPPPVPPMEHHQHQHSNTQWAHANGQRLFMTAAAPAGAASALPPPPLPASAAMVVDQLLGMAPPLPTLAATTSGSGCSTSQHGGSGAYCIRCGSARPDVRFPCCGFRAHARCLVDAQAWPCRACPGCGVRGAAADGGALPVEVILPEPFRRNGEAVAVSEQELARTRGGRWQEAEVRFAEMVMEQFGRGALPLKDGARLGTFLCSLLQCSAARLSSKLRTGKRNYQYQAGSPAEAKAREQAQRSLSQQEELFLHFLPAEEAAVAAQALQREWRLQFLGFAQGKGQPLANLAAWEDILREQLGEAATDVMLHGHPPVEPVAPPPPRQEEGPLVGAARLLPVPSPPPGAAAAGATVVDHSYHGSSHNGMAGGAGSGASVHMDTEDGRPRPAKRRAPAPSATSPIPTRPAPLARPPPPHSPAQHPHGALAAMRGLPPLLVRMSADRRRDYTVAHGVLGATSIEDLLSLLRAGPPQELALLARASNSAILFASAGLQRALVRDDADLLGSVLFGPAENSPGSGGGLVHPDDAVVLQLAFRESQRRVARLLERMGNPHPPMTDADLTVAPLVLRLRRGGRGMSARELGGTFIDIDAAFGARHHLTAFATDDFFLLHAPGPRVHHHPADVGPAAAAVEAGIRSMALGVATAGGGRGRGPYPQQQGGAQRQPPPGRQAAVVQPASLRFPQVTVLQAMTGGAGGVGGPLTLPPPVPHYQQHGAQPPSGLVPMPTAGAAVELGRSRARSGSYPPPPRVEEVGPDGRPLALPPAPSVAASAGSSSAPGSMDACGEVSLAWEGEALEWCDDEDLSLALQHLGEDGTGTGAGAGTGNATGTATLATTQSTAPSSPSVQDAWGGAYDLCYAPPTSFEQTMRAFLQGLPFEAVDIWVPLRDPASGRLSLQFGGGLAVRPTLSQWVFYSRNFAFYEGQGMPGRVFRSQSPEYVEDVTTLDSSLFLRRDGAQMAGVHTSFGVPVVQGNTVFVLVFYSGRRGDASHRQEAISAETLDYIRRSTSAWRIETTFSPTSTSLSTFVATSAPMAAGARGPVGPRGEQQQMVRQN